MQDYQKPYHMLFNAAADAVAAIESQNYGEARRMLIQVQQDCEELVISSQEDEEN